MVFRLISYRDKRYGTKMSSINRLYQLIKNEQNDDTLGDIVHHCSTKLSFNNKGTIVQQVNIIKLNDLIVRFLSIVIWRICNKIDIKLTEVEIKVLQASKVHSFILRIKERLVNYLLCNYLISILATLFQKDKRRWKQKIKKMKISNQMMNNSN